MARLDELIALAALGELAPADALELDDAIRDDPDAAARLDDALAAAAAVQAVHPVPPPAHLRSAVLDAIATVPQEPAPTAAAGSPPVLGRVIPLRTSRKNNAVRWITAAAAVLIVAVGLTWSTRGGESQADRVAAVIEADDVVRRDLDGGFAESLTVGFSASEAALVVLGEGVPTLSASETYQLWLVDDEGATSAGLFRPDAKGVVEFRVDGVDPTGFTVGITKEPAAGSATPTAPILASA